MSNVVNAQPEFMPTNALRASDYLWQWGQFLDHDIDLTDVGEPPAPGASRDPKNGVPGPRKGGGPEKKVIGVSRAVEI